MTAIQLLEKLGAESTFNKSDLSPQDINAIIHLSNDTPDFSAPLTHVCPEDDEDECDEEENND